MSSTRLRRAMATAFAATLATGGLVAAATGPAAATTTPVSGVTFEWTGSEELQKAPPFGGGNPFSAGVSDGTESQYRAVDGNVSIVHVDPDGVETTPTWATRLAPAGGSVDQLVRFSNGTGSVEDDGSGAITWDGDWSINFYGGLLPFTLSDPVLTVAADGTGELTADLAGYASSQADPNVKEPLPPATDVTVATFSGVDLSPEGEVTVDPAYEGVEVDVAPTAGAPQERSNDGWGAWPQEFVDFHLDSGLSSYWYSSGGAADPYKAPADFTVSVPAQPAQVTVSSTVAHPDGTTTVTVSGTGFDPSLATGTRPPLAGQPSGAYVTFGKFAADWKPSAGAPAAGRVGIGTKWAVLAEHMALIGGTGNGAIELTPEGTFTTEITLDKPALDTLVESKDNAADLVNYGIYTYAGGGATQPLYETYTPVTFEEPERREFTDVPDDHVFAENMQWLADNGISTGYDNGDGTWSFRPGEPVLREQMAAFLYRTQTLLTGSAPEVDLTGPSPFTDVTPDHTFYKEIVWLAQQEISTGYDNGNGTWSFRPSAPVLREQMAAFLYRFADADRVDDDGPTFADLPPSHVFFQHVEWLATTDITRGYDEPDGTTTYRGSQPVLREQMAAFLNRLADRLGPA